MRLSPRCTNFSPLHSLPHNLSLQSALLPWLLCFRPLSAVHRALCADRAPVPTGPVSQRLPMSSKAWKFSFTLSFTLPKGIYKGFSLQVGYSSAMERSANYRFGIPVYLMSKYFMALPHEYQWSEGVKPHMGSWLRFHSSKLGASLLLSRLFPSLPLPFLSMGGTVVHHSHPCLGVITASISFPTV